MTIGSWKNNFAKSILISSMTQISHSFRDKRGSISKIPKNTCKVILFKKLDKIYYRPDEEFLMISITKSEILNFFCIFW